MSATITEKPLNVRLPVDLAAQLAALTKATGRTKSALTVAAIREYVEAEAWQIQDTLEGIAEADRGEFATDEEVAAFFAKHGG
ncbi:CopG family ribbon-helix-helix protein [Massilia genomosp. 1]|uniref:Ribbon-helix-helix protein, CopG family n=1 Tax=Massilia genomosp. 1 TaxID=2609280 RepID=A0ABX0N0S5_9BURK|nr:ribbon-helix-helix protein, CopG family [Massilia genomosp. 1]NHZ66625.1 ribbon-helix-helix protein, CopG family [Massilia genomosp. 1]